MALIAHTTAGEGEPIVLLNGGLMTMASWAEISASLETTNQVIRCDFRGQLMSPSDEAQTVSQHAADVAAVLDSLGMTSAHIAGTSFGAFVGIAFAASYPERTRSLTVISATEAMTERMDEGSRQVIEAAKVAAGGGERTKVFDLIIPATFRAAYLEAHADRFAGQRAAAALLPAHYFSGVAAIVTAIVGLDLRPMLRKITAPTLVVAAAEDTMFPLQHSKALASAIRGAILEVVAESGHGVVVEQPGTITEMIRAFAGGRAKRSFGAAAMEA